MIRSEVVPVAGTVNFRDVASPHDERPSILPGRLFRSDSVHAVSGLGIDQVRHLGIRTVVDLRSSVETEVRPSVFPAGNIELVPVPLELMSLDESARTDLTLETLYDRMLVERGEGLARAVRAIARAPRGAVLVHCTAGKDRTGLTIALALSTVGVALSRILDDYALTEHTLRGQWTRSMVDALEVDGIEVDARLLRILAASPAESLAAALNTNVFEPWGSAASYLRAHGLTQYDLTALRERLVHPSLHRTGELAR